MNKLIIIIHSSEIIRKGLAAILRSFFTIEILQLEDVNDLHSYREMKNHSLIVIFNIADWQNNEHLKKLEKNNKARLIFFDTFTDYNPSQNFCEQWINLDTTALEIQQLISDCWKTGDKPTNRQHQNDELTTREKEVLRLVALGLSNKIIADKLFISIHTVISHRKNISEKTGIKSISGLTVYAILNNLIDTSTINPDDLI